MCYHVSTTVKRALKNQHKDGFRISDESERYGAYDLPDLPGTLTTIGQTDFVPLEWGLIPRWARDLEHARQLQASGRNAKAETMFDKPMFRDAAVNGRCLIWLDGFYEWQHLGKKKIPYFIHMPDRKLFPVGGLMSQWQNPADGEVLSTCTIVTTEANELMTEIHNSKKRMPLIMPEEARGRWLEGWRSRAEIEEICVPMEDGVLVAEPVEDEQISSPVIALF